MAASTGDVVHGARRPLGTVRAVSLAPPAVQRSQSSHVVAPLRVLSPQGLIAAKLRAQADYQRRSGGSAESVSPSPPLTGLFNNLNQPGFSAADDVWCCTPPDSTGAIGPTRYVEIVNQRVGVFDRSLNRLTQLDLGSFVGAPGALVTTDSQIEWDAPANRWLYASLGFQTGGNYLLFGWSKTADPSDLLGGWCRYGVNTGSSLNDYPKLGHDDNFLIVGTNIYDDSQPRQPFVTANVWVVPKPLASDSTCSSPVRATFFADATHPLKNADGTPAFTPVPANTTDLSPTGYILAAHSPVPSGPQTKVMVWHMALQTGSPALVADGDVSVGTFDIPASVPQPGPSLDSLDGRLTQAVARRDPSASGAEAVWTQHTIAGPGGRSVVRWYEFLPALLAVRQQGQVASGTDFVFNAAISPTWGGSDAAVVYNRASATALPTMAAQSRQATTASGVMDPGELLLGTSSAPNQDFSCGAPYGPPCRWGDYAGATPDPLNPGVIWASNQLVGPTIFPGLPQWTTRNVAITTRPAATPMTYYESVFGFELPPSQASGIDCSAPQVAPFVGASAGDLPGSWSALIPHTNLSTSASICPGGQFGLSTQLNGQQTFVVGSFLSGSVVRTSSSCPGIQTYQVSATLAIVASVAGQFRIGTGSFQNVTLIHFVDAACNAFFAIVVGPVSLTF